jgi:molybdopterin molybdotransferase
MAERPLAGGRMEAHLARATAGLAVDEALAAILAAVPVLEATEAVTLPEALGRLLGEEATAPTDQPPWDNSAMDGYAARSEDLRAGGVDGAGGGAPVRLRVVEEVPAGGFPTRALGRGEAIRIMTGAPVPEGADSVVRAEDTRLVADGAGGAGGAVVEVLDARDAGRNIRCRGEDVRRGEVVLRAGTPLRPAELGLLASVGRFRPRVRRRPRVAILSNGDELAGPDEFGEVLAGRKIVNSNSWALDGAVRSAGCEPAILGIARDTVASLRERLAAGAAADALITTAGASVGEHDLIKDVLAELGFDLRFWRVAMKPGSPFSFGLLGRQPVFGLPGNPVSALVTFEVLVRPALRRMQGRADVYPRTVTAVADEALPGDRSKTHFVRVALAADGEGRLLARSTGPQGSGILTSLHRADGLAAVPAGVGVVEAGAEVTVLPLPPADAGTTRPGPVP